jgi:hypothetical protein
MHVERDRRAGPFARRAQHGVLGERRAVVASHDGIGRAAEPRVDLLDVWHDGRNENEAWCTALARAHPREEKLKADAAAASIKEVALVADDQRDLPKEIAARAEQPGKRLGRRHDDARAIEVTDLVT